MLCAVTSVLMAVLLTVLSVSALIGALDTLTTSNESKIDSTLQEKMATASPDEKIPVAIWYSDVDQDNIDKLTAQKVGFTQDDVAVAYEMPSTELLASIDKEEAGAKDEMQAYLKRTEGLRKLERERTEEYIMTRREFSRSKYNEKSAKLIKDVDIKAEDITFQSQYAPMILAELTASEVEIVGENSNVTSISFYESPEGEECSASNIKDYTGYNDVVNAFSLTGEGVKIGTYESGNKPLEGIAELPYGNIITVRDTEYKIDHVTNTLRILVGADNGFAPDAYVFTSTSGGSNNILSYTSSTGIFVRSTTAPVINTYRMWVLEDINYRRGDTDLDGNITISDATTIQKYLGGLEVFNNVQLYLADYNRDGVVSVKDVTAIQTFISDI